GLILPMSLTGAEGPGQTLSGTVPGGAPKPAVMPAESGYPVRRGFADLIGTLGILDRPLSAGDDAVIWKCRTDALRVFAPRTGGIAPGTAPRSLGRLFGIAPWTVGQRRRGVAGWRPSRLVVRRIGVVRRHVHPAGIG